MAYELKPGQFSLFKNDKGDNASRPDYRGDGQDLAGNDIEVAAWIKKSANGKTYMSCSIKPKQAKPESKPAPKSVEDMDSDIPFN